MNSDHFKNAPGLKDSFEETHEPSFPLEHDALNWEPVEDHEIEQPSEKHLELHYTPGNALEQEVHTQLDRAARIRIEERSYYEMNHKLPDEHELNFDESFNRSSRSAGEHDSMRDGIAKATRFERELRRDLSHEWER
jgi:hypothetical protein